MKIQFSDYRGGFRVFSLALDEKTKEDLLVENIGFIYVQSMSAFVYPEGTVLTYDLSILEKLNTCNDYDVFVMSEDGVLSRYYDDSSVENAFFITGLCNSNCIMCPSPDSSRQRGNEMGISDLITIASHIPSDAAHITVTGGEPFMAGKDIFKLFEYCKEKFKYTEFLILTNARVFAINEYCEQLRDTIPDHSMVGVPLHGSCAQIHDNITRAEKSFDQTMIGIKRLQQLGIQIEIRIVVCKQNLKDLEALSKVIVSELSHVHHVNIMAMEMTGNAYKNADLIWVSYRESFRYVKKAIDVLIESGIDVRLYNYPLCAVDQEYRMICAKSISSWKVKYSPDCVNCVVKESCGGVFAGSYRLACEELKAIS